jgi:DNA-binding response OmpR family regulator
MPIQIRLVIADPVRCEWLKQMLKHVPEFAILSDDPEVDDGRCADLFIVDLAHPQASLPRLWMTIRFMYPEARLMGLVDTPPDETALQAALHAGVCDFAEWAASADELLTRAWDACVAYRRMPPVSVCVAASALFTRLREDERQAHPLRLGALRVDATKRCVTLGDRPVDLTPLELNALAHLARNAGRVVAATELWREVWGCCRPVSGWREAVKKVILRLRQKIEPDPARPRYLLTVRRRGYCLSAGLLLEAPPRGPASENQP